MYRDIIGAPTRITIGENEWWYQQFCKWDGNLKAVRLYDKDGDFVSEFPSMEELFDFLKGVIE